MGSISAGVNAAIGAKVPVGVSTLSMDDPSVPDFFHVMIYGPTNSYRTTTGAKFGGPKRTLIVSTRSPEQVRIPLGGQGYHAVFVNDADALIWAMQCPEKAADHAGFPEWKDQADRVLMLDDMTEGMALLVDDNSVRDNGTEVKDGRQIYGGAKQDVRAVINSLKRKRIHIVYTALEGDSDTGIFPDMPVGSRKLLLADLEYVFYMKPDKKRMQTKRENVPYVVKDQFGKDQTKVRVLEAKCKIPDGAAGRTPPLISGEEPMDLGAVWTKICSAKVKL